jgi:hypothetical protein
VDACPPDVYLPESVALVDAGREPRRQLRYHPCVNCEEHAILEHESASQYWQLSAAHPDTIFRGGRFRSTLTIAISAGSKPERIRYSMALSDSAFLGVEAGESRSAIKTRSDLEAAERVKLLDETRGNAQIDSRGRADHRRLYPMDGSLYGVQRELGVLSVPLPAEPVGVGAIWRVIDPPFQDNYYWMREVATFELTAAEGDQLEISAVVREISEQERCGPREEKKPVRSDSRGCNPIRRELLWRRGERTSELHVDLGRLLPVKRTQANQVYEMRITRELPERMDLVSQTRMELLQKLPIPRSIPP